jgi:hypothetical protein
MENRFEQKSRKIRAIAIVIALAFHATIIAMAAGGVNASSFEGIKEKVINVFSPAQEDMKSDFRA